MENLEKLYGVGKNIAERLRNSGYETIDAIAEANPADLAQKIDVFPAIAKKIVNSAKEATEIKMGEEEALGMEEEREKLIEEEQTTEEPTTEEPTTEEPTTEEPTTEEPTTEEPPTEKSVEKVSPHEKRVSVLVEAQKNNEELSDKILQEAAKSAASTIKESVEFRRTFLNEIMKNKDFRRQVIYLVAKELSDS